MQRREFITLFGGAAVVWPLTARAQQGERMRRVGVLTGYSETDSEAQARFKIFQQSLHDLGWTVGQNIQIDYRWSGGDTDHAKVLAKKLVEIRPDVILGETTSSVRALQQVTHTIPIVFTNLSNPVGSNFVAGMARPGGNITGFTNFESSMESKWLEVLKEILPSVLRVAIMFNPTVSPHIAAGYYLHELEEAAQRLTVEQAIAPVQSVDDIERVINTLADKPNSGLIILPDTFTLVHRNQIIGLAAQHRLPAVYSLRSFAVGGGLISYGVNPMDQFPRAASYIDRILKGEKAGDLPVQTPTKFELVINLKTAKALGLTVPPTMLTQADEVIE
jgi:putative tryptophan/tyrosine transport system substrate-binding protein